MNRKIYYKNHCIRFSDDPLQSTSDQPFKSFQKVSDPEACRQILSHLMSDTQPFNIHLPSSEFEAVFSMLKKELKYIEAAGGLIERQGLYLCIHRLGRWDLPKGKLEKQESPGQAALRECEEECGVRDLVIVSALNSTFHIYEYKKGHALKQSYWFYMRTAYDKKLKAQKEEDIDEARWFTEKEIVETVLPDTYFTIRDVLKEGLGI